MSNCTIGIRNVVEAKVEGKPWFRFNGTDFVEILSSPNDKITPERYWGVAKGLASGLNKSLNSDIKIGDIFYPRTIDGRVGMLIDPTPQQLNKLNAKNEQEIEEANKDWEEKQHQERLNKLDKLSQEEQERGGYTEENKGEFFQKEGTESSIASPATIKIVNDLLKRIGVDIKSLNKERFTGNNAAALIMQKLVQVVEGKEATSLPEEAMHFVVEILKQKNPALYNKLLKEINNYQLLQQVFKDYTNDSRYKTKEGKPDVIKLKEEAIGKVLAETVIKLNEGSTEKPELLSKVQTWWKDIIDFFKLMFVKSGFDQAALDIITGKTIGTAEDIKADENTIFLQKESQEGIYNNIKNVASRIEKKDEVYYIDGKKIGKRVSDIIHTWYDEIFAEKKLLNSEHQNAIDDLKAEKGTAGHADFEYAFSLFVDENGYLRDVPLDDTGYISQIGSREMYEILRDNLRERLNSLDNQRGIGRTRFMSEVTIYNAKRDLAGTIDLLAIHPDGKIDILDWKFMNLKTEKYEDVPWFKINAWNKQMLQYKLILQYAYGIKNEDFGQTRMIPIQAVYSEGNAKQKILPKLLSVKIGDVNVKNITQAYLLPVGLEGEKTGNEDIDKKIEELNGIYERLSQKKVTPENKDEKARQLNALFSAIRHLQIKQDVRPLIRQALLLNKLAEKTIETYNTKFKGVDSASFSEEEMNNYAGEVNDILDSIHTYTTLDTELESVFPTTLSEDDKMVLKEMSEAANNARRLELRLQKTLDAYVSETIAKSEKINDFLSPEKIIKGISKWLVSTAGLQSKAIQVLYRKANKAFTKASFDTETEIKRLMGIKETYDVWAKSKNLSHKNYFDIIKKKNENELIDEFSPEFYKELKKHIQDKDFEWIRDNIDIPKYNEFLKEKLETEIQKIKDRNDRILSQEEIDRWEKYDILPREIENEIDVAKRLYDASTSEAAGWLLEKEIKAFPKREKWESTEWKELNKKGNEAAKIFYDYIIERNKEYRDLGYISNARTFLPFVRKNLTEKLITGGDIRFGEQFFKSISIDEGDIGYGKIDPITGELINIIPKYFTNKLDDEISTDLFHTMAMYNNAAIKYKYVKNIEQQMIAILKTEKNKKAIATSLFGKTQYKDGKLQFTPDNNENSKLFQDMMHAIIYDQRYIESETFDQLLFKLGSWGENFNRKLGMKIFPEDLSNRQVSINKSITQLNSMFQLNILGLNVLSATSNLFGGNMQSIINAGVYFTKADYVKAEGILFMNKFNGTDKKKLIGALEYFLPLTHDYNGDLMKKLSLNGLTQEGIQDFLMTLMRRSDLNVETSNFYAYLFNMIVVDGKVINVREYLRNQPEYADKYAGTQEERKTFEERFDNEVKRLIEEQGVLKLATIENNTFVIPGVDRMDNSVIETRRKIHQLSKDALGNMTPDDLRKVGMNVYSKSAMVFKNWIPRLVDVRIGNLKYNSASDAYEWGRMRTVYRIITEDLVHSIGNLKNALLVNDKGVEFMRQLYEKKKADYEADTGKTLEMTETQFIDLVRANVKNQMLDVMFLTIMLTLVAGLKAIPPDKDEDEMVKNQYRFIVRALDKFSNELSYFYDPTSFTTLISQGIFPSLSMLDNMRKAVVNFGKENYGLFVGDEELLKKNYVIKYWMKSFPFTNQMIGYLPMFYPELAKDLGIKINANYSLKR